MRQAVPLRPESIEDLLAPVPELREPFRRYYGRVFDGDVAPADLLELGRLCVAHVHACEAERAIRISGAGLTDAQIAAIPRWRESGLFTELQRAALGLAEKIPYGHREVTEEDVASLRRTLGERQLVGYVIALGLFDATCRMRLVFDMKPKSQTLERPAAATAPLA